MFKPNNTTTALLSLRPGCAWTMTDDDYENIIWNSEESKPTFAEIEAEIARLDNEQANAVAAADAAKEAAQAKLAALGLTPEEIAALSK
jgi:hypothetical protein